MINVFLQVIYEGFFLLGLKFFVLIFPLNCNYTENVIEQFLLCPCIKLIQLLGRIRIRADVLIRKSQS
jgi:hypothetical protein